MAETENKLKQETRALQKKLSVAEKNIKEKLKSVVTRQLQSEEKEILLSSSAVKQPDQQKFAAMKQRLNSLEKSYELLKQKSMSLEDQNRELSSLNAKLTEDLTKVKQSKQKVTKEFNELKQSTQNLKMQDLLI